MKNKHEVAPESAAQVWDWLTNRGGIAIWNSAYLNEPGQTWTCPINDAEGNPAKKQHWKMGKIVRTITDPSEVVVVEPEEVSRFPVSLKRSGGFSVSCTTGSSDKIKKAVSKASKGDCEAWYEFDYDTQEAVIYVPSKVTPIEEFV